MNEAGHWADVLDSEFRVVFTTDELERSYAWVGMSGSSYRGCHLFSSAFSIVRAAGDLGLADEELRAEFGAVFPEVLDGTPGGRAALRELVDPRLRDLVDELPAGVPRTAVSRQDSFTRMWGIKLGSWTTLLRLWDSTGEVAGYLRISKPAPGMSILGTIGGVGDVRHLERAQAVTRADRRPTAILFADLEASSPLSRRLSTADYFRLSRRLVRVADQCVVDAGGLVGRHLGDGVTAFFLAETVGSESAAARAAIEAMRALRIEAAGAAARSDLTADDVVMRFGLHWGATLYVGLIKSVARTEITALGDEVNEAARIEACASGGRALASKALLERLEPDDAKALDLEHLAYTPLGELATATDKARRDAPAIAVCEI